MKVKFTTKLGDLETGYAFVFAGAQLIDDNVWMRVNPTIGVQFTPLWEAIPEGQALIVSFTAIRDEAGKLTRYPGILTFSLLTQIVVPLLKAELCI